MAKPGERAEVEATGDVIGHVFHEDEVDRAGVGEQILGHPRVALRGVGRRGHIAWARAFRPEVIWAAVGLVKGPRSRPSCG